MLDHLWSGFEAGDRRALSRILSLIDRGECLDQIAQRLAGSSAEGLSIAVTGAGGVGKSSLVSRLVQELHARGTPIGVLACDPQSPVTGGALLGDRIRMPNFDQESAAPFFLRSLAVPSGRQGIADHIELMIRLMISFGLPVVFVETVGAGQGDIAIRRVVDRLIVLLQPEAGDDFQWEKAGLLEVADVVVLHKGDLPRAQRIEGSIRELLNLPGCRQVPVLRVSSATGEGIDALWQLISGAR